MKSYFIRLFNYNLFANKQTNGLVQARPNEKAVHLMTHLLFAEHIWLQRCKGMSTAGINVWPEGQLSQLLELIEKSHNEWISLINTLVEGDFDKNIHYQNSTGAKFDTLMCDIMAHVVNHGTHTRAQIGQLLKLDDADKLPVTDYSYYLRK
ncbi:DinB family protein [Mucilaginibacter glaciei]|uniref:DinB family protein n=1 Tax=Mucilaginibacter glaciei TaxID=2772109 RepID=A0A926S0Q2_9SPHI|nr:DinB family protein [Mucilaginibacter glaciei]MBD1392228.1 DinB family protein [Mucilaginibacter glaciei]